MHNKFLNSTTTHPIAKYILARSGDPLMLHGSSSLRTSYLADDAFNIKKLQELYKKQNDIINNILSTIKKLYRQIKEYTDDFNNLSNANFSEFSQENNVTLTTKIEPLSKSVTITLNDVSNTINLVRYTYSNNNVHQETFGISQSDNHDISRLIQAIAIQHLTSICEALLNIVEQYGEEKKAKTIVPYNPSSSILIPQNLQGKEEEEEEEENFLRSPLDKQEQEAYVSNSDDEALVQETSNVNYLLSMYHPSKDLTNWGSFAQEEQKESLQKIPLEEPTRRPALSPDEMPFSSAYVTTSDWPVSAELKEVPIKTVPIEKQLTLSEQKSSPLAATAPLAASSTISSLEKKEQEKEEEEEEEEIEEKKKPEERVETKEGIAVIQALESYLKVLEYMSTNIIPFQKKNPKTYIEYCKNTALTLYTKLNSLIQDILPIYNPKTYSLGLQVINRTKIILNQLLDTRDKTINTQLKVAMEKGIEDINRHVYFTAPFLISTSLRNNLVSLSKTIKQEQFKKVYVESINEAKTLISLFIGDYRTSALTNTNLLQAIQLILNIFSVFPEHSQDQNIFQLRSPTQQESTTLQAIPSKPISYFKSVISNVYPEIVNNFNVLIQHLNKTMNLSKRKDRAMYNELGKIIRKAEKNFKK